MGSLARADHPRLDAAIQRARYWRLVLPRGRSLPENVWRRRHRGITWMLWAHVVGLFAFLIYHNWELGLVMAAAMLLNLLLAAVMGVTIPILMEKLGRDPALGSSALITAITDSGGFFIFLGLATLFLVR